MNTSLFELDPKKIRSKGVSEELKIDTIEYIQTFSDIFVDSFMENVYSKVFKSNFISSEQISNIQKRMINIPISKNENEKEIVTKYIEKYWKIIFPANLVLTKTLGFERRTSNFEFEKLQNVIEFYEKYGYITDRQKSAFITPIIPIFGVINNRLKKAGWTLDTKKVSVKSFEVISKNINKLMLINISDEIPEHWKDQEGFKYLIESIENYSNLSSTDDEKTMEAKIKKHPDVRIIPKKFMSLQSLRGELEI